jgi:hypothetical protein
VLACVFSFVFLFRPFSLHTTVISFTIIYSLVHTNPRPMLPVVLGSAAPLSCFFLTLMTVNLTLYDVPIPTPPIDIAHIANMSNIVCAELALPGVNVTYNATELSIDLRQETIVRCHANFIMEGDPSQLYLELSVPPGGFMLDLVASPTSCLTQNASLAYCNLAPTISNLTLTPAGPNGLWNDIFQWVESLINGGAEKGLCDGLKTALVSQLLNHTLPAPIVPPPLAPGLTPLVDAALIRMVVNIVNNLPVLFNMRLAAAVLTPSSLGIDITFLEDLNFGYEPLLAVQLPYGTTMSLELWFENFYCYSTFGCRVAVENGVRIENLRVHRAGDADRMFDALIGPSLSKAIDDILLFFEMSGQTNSSSTEADLTAKPAEIVDQPPFALGVSIAAGFSAIAIGVIAYSASRHTHRPVIGANGQPVPLRRIIVEDSIVVIACFGTMFLFAWSNCTTAAIVWVGNELPMYGFSLGNTVTDLWQAGLYPLSFFVCLFSGVYPYAKLLCIVLYSVVLQQPQSRVLRLVDALGKFSFLDSFVMMIMVTGLEVNGIANVEMRASFFVFVAATCLSIIVGNYATHGWRREVLPGYPQVMAVNRAEPSSPLTPSEDERIPQEQRKWNWKVAIPSFAVIVTASVISCLYVSLEYQISGAATVVTGTEKNFNLYDLFTATTWPLYLTGFFTIMVAPALYVLLYPKSYILASWCATDAFLLACVAGLVQLEQFIKFVMGPSMSSMYSAKAVLHWPLLLLGFGMLIQWACILWQVIGCNRKRQGIATESKWLMGSGERPEPVEKEYVTM